MRCLSLWAPWGSLVASGAKRIETRPLPPNGMNPKGVRGYPGHAIKPGERIGIHQTAHVRREVYELLDSRHGDELRAICADELPGWAPRQRNLGLPLGQVLCTVAVSAVWPMHRPDSVPFEVEALELPYLEVDDDRLTLQPAGTDWSHEYRMGHFDNGRWAWLLTDREQLYTEGPSVPGHQGIWEWEG